jgi:hypothetical protein
MYTIEQKYAALKCFTESVIDGIGKFVPDSDNQKIAEHAGERTFHIMRDNGLVNVVLEDLILDILKRDYADTMAAAEDNAAKQGYPGA